MAIENFLKPNLSLTQNEQVTSKNTYLTKPVKFLRKTIHHHVLNKWTTDRLILAVLLRSPDDSHLVIQSKVIKDGSWMLVVTQ